ncbi:MAG: hypothetical protein CL917_11520 [Deltaproteobacteria bacterium]|nr:hypothetical protein [Deltaproteobacteria bacterium]
MPFQVGATIWLNLRIAVLAWVLIFLVLGDAMVRNLLGKAALVGLCLLQLTTVVDAHRAFGEELNSLFEVMDSLEPEGRLLPVTLTGESEVLTPFYKGDPVRGLRPVSATCCTSVAVTIWRKRGSARG